MSIQKVGWEYINGVPAFNNLIKMMEVAIQGASLRIHAKSAGWDFKGFHLENKGFWCGMYYSDPLLVTFEIVDKKKFNAKLVDTPSYPIREDKDSIWFRLQLEDKHFFSLTKDEQIEEITKFIKTAYSEAQQMRIKE